MCLDKVDGVSIKAWESVAKRSPEVLNKCLIEVSPNGKILDQMKEQLSRTIFRASVEKEMADLGFENEAKFCNVIREALFITDDTPSIAAKERCQKRLNLIKWLANGIDKNKRTLSYSL